MLGHETGQHPRRRRTTATFREAVLAGIAPGGGLWLPDPLPVFDDWPACWSWTGTDRCAADDGPPAGGRARPRARRAGRARRRSISRCPWCTVRPGVFALELFHGPTLAFKDFGARFFAAVLDLVREPGRPVTILTATSGDTGAAVAQAFWKREGVRAVVLYPRGRVSALQERQFATLGENVTALSVDGAFDDCQTLVKAAFADADLSARHGLTSANSINVARLLPQTLYYAEAVARLRALGDLRAAGHRRAQRQLRQPLRRPAGPGHGPARQAFVAATNANATVPDYLETGTYRPRPSVATLSNAMDVGAPNNWERIEHLFGGDLEALRRVLRWGWKSDEETEETIRAPRDDLGYLADPHAAVAYGVLAEQPGTRRDRHLPRHRPPRQVPARLREAGHRRAHPGRPWPSSRDRPLLAREIPNELGALLGVLAEGD